MQVFLCWSGKRSHTIAEALHAFLGDAIQQVKPFLSSESIRKGGRWRDEISQQLANCNFGILCFTKENLDSRWILFEAGALAKLPKSGVTALLAGITSTEIQEPLSQFQHTGITREEIAKLLADINSLVPADTRLDSDRLRRTFDAHWPALEKKLAEALALKNEGQAKPKRDEASMIAETLELVRELKRSSDVGQLAAALTSSAPGTFGNINAARIFDAGYNPITGSGALSKFASNPMRLNEILALGTPAPTALTISPATSAAPALSIPTPAAPTPKKKE